jgi:uncharacterized protein
MRESDVLAELLGHRPLTRTPDAAASATPQSFITLRHTAIALIAAFIGAGLWVGMANLVLTYAYDHALFGAKPDPAFVTIVANGVVFAGVIAIAIAGRRWMPIPLPLEKMALWMAVPFALTLGVGGMMLSFGAAALAGHVIIAKVSVMPGIGMLVIGVFVVLFQTAAEELFFRGWFQPSLAKGWGSAVALTATSVAFALLHVFGGARDPLSFLNIFLAGVFFGLLALRTGGLAAPLAGHFAWNGTEQFVVGADPNPGIGAFGSLFDYDIVGSALWGGSGEGLNASLATTAVMLAMIIPLAVWKRGISTVTSA